MRKTKFMFKNIIIALTMSANLFRLSASPYLVMGAAEVSLLDLPCTARSGALFRFIKLIDVVVHRTKSIVPCIFFAAIFRALWITFYSVLVVVGPAQPLAEDSGSTRRTAFAQAAILADRVAVPVEWLLAGFAVVGFTL